MAKSIEDKLVVGISSSALFDLSESDKVFREHGEDKYREYQRENIDNTLQIGVAFPFIKRVLHLNNIFDELQPVEVVLLSKNDPETGLRVFRSIKKYELTITRAAFTTGKSPYQYIPAFNISLFLSKNPNDVLKAIEAGYPAGTVMPSKIEDDSDPELRIAFDFDGVIADDESETIYKETKDIEAFNKHEMKNVHLPHKPGPLGNLFRKLAFIQKLELKKELQDKSYRRRIRTAIITARGAPSHERVVTTLSDWGVSADETFFLDGIKKHNILEIFKPHIFFDDQLDHLKSVAGNVPMVHIPFGIANKPSS
ncbi:MAG: 5'-nucleotidase [Planctomycetota bacterium]|nr:MAG: 5'-nucleotidase [Planctomycetota bacterium]